MQIEALEHLMQLLGQLTHFPLMSVCPAPQSIVQKPPFKMDPVGQDRQFFGPD